jgi:hypothetical protein
VLRLVSVWVAGRVLVARSVLGWAFRLACALRPPLLSVARLALAGARVLAAVWAWRVRPVWVVAPLLVLGLV